MGKELIEVKVSACPGRDRAKEEQAVIKAQAKLVSFRIQSLSLHHRDAIDRTRIVWIIVLVPN